MAGKPSNSQGSFFRSVHTGEQEFDSEKFLYEVGSQFKSTEIQSEVSWRIQALREIAARPENKAASEGLKKQLSKIFATTTEESEILSQLKALTEIKGADGKALDLRSFTKRDKRQLTEVDYRRALGRKLTNTKAQLENLLMFFPEDKSALNGLSQALDQLANKTKSASTSIVQIKAEEDNLRQTPLFAAYEKLKEKFLKQWLTRFSELSESEVNQLAPEDVQRLIMEHQRHQMTHLLKTQIKPSDLDMTEHLDVHDTLEGSFKDKGFWSSANPATRTAFKFWVEGAIQAFGMTHGKRYAFFQNGGDQDQYLLFGIGVSDFAKDNDKMLELVPYIKPFTRKSGYLLEIRQRDLGNNEEYYAELRHYVLPFLFAFDHMPGFKLGTDLINFFTSKY